MCHDGPIVNKSPMVRAFGYDVICDCEFLSLDVLTYFQGSHDVVGRFSLLILLLALDRF